ENAVTVVRNAGFTFSDASSVFSWAYHIDSRDKFLAWGRQYKQWTANDKVYLDADIDLTCDEDDASSLWTPHNFSGSFDGQGHKISRIVTVANARNTGLFAQLSGSVKNLVIGSSDGLVWDGVSHIRHAWENTTDWANVGAVCGAVGSTASIEDVTNFAKLEILSTDAGKGRIGGIAAFSLTPGVQITRCVNRGTLVNNQPSACAGNNVMGGILAAAELAATLTDCTNYGPITSNNANVKWIGGIIGATNGPAAVGNTGTGWGSTLVNCDNYGTVTATAGPANMGIGGIAGYLSGGTLSQCDNASTGLLASSCAVVVHIGGVAGLMGCDNAIAMTSCTNSATLSSANDYVDMGGLVAYADFPESDEAVSVSDSHNYGNLTLNATTAGETHIHIGGLFGKLISTATRVVSVSDCTNEGTVSSSKPNTAAGYVAGLGSEVKYITLTRCANLAVVTSTAGTYNQNVGGLVGYSPAGTSLVSCRNEGPVSLTLAGSSGNRVAKVGGLIGGGYFQISGGSSNSGNVTATGLTNDSCAGGIAGAIQGSVDDTASTITGTEAAPVVNSGQVCMNGTVRRYAGGIVGYATGTSSSVSYAKNTGKIYSSTGGHLGVGGVVGCANLATLSVSHCTNEGTVENKFTSSGTLYRWAGGIVGRHIGKSNSLSASNCVNGKSGDSSKGAVTMTLNSLPGKPRGVLAGGIVGGSSNKASISGNINYAPVSLTNSRSGGYGYAGGIFGGDFDPDDTATGSVEISGNTNYGSVSLSVNAAPRAGAGGILGEAYAAVSAQYTGNVSRGDVSVSGTITAGGAGAVIGDAEGNPTGVTVTVSKSITVGGVTWSAASAAGTLPAWLCLNCNNIIASYED
ncbi:MAG: hypothetical protein IJR34_04215, partial [Bacteroidales bacterium]|nr:hypothetical protein [Bacteroidales bacterium]